jgi:hypothetical protein
MAPARGPARAGGAGRVGMQRRAHRGGQVPGRQRLQPQSAARLRQQGGGPCSPVPRRRVHEEAPWGQSTRHPEVRGLRRECPGRSRPDIWADPSPCSNPSPRMRGVGPPTTYAANRLVWIVAKDNPLDLQDLDVFEADRTRRAGSASPRCRVGSRHGRCSVQQGVNPEPTSTGTAARPSERWSTARCTRRSCTGPTRSPRRANTPRSRCRPQLAADRPPDAAHDRQPVGLDS